MISIKLEIPVRVTIVREGYLAPGKTTSTVLDVKEICLPRNFEVYLNQQTGVLLLREADEPDGK